jgi:hypothetical protein
MNKIEKITTTALLSVSLGLGGFLVGKAISQNQVERLENKVENAQIEKNNVERENYQLHLNLIEKGNPYDWELWGDAIGNRRGGKLFRLF